MMRPFSLELAYVSGWHDGERVHIAEPNDPHVIVHEDVHADILRTTPDGQLLWFAILFSSQSDLAPDFVGQHIEQSRRAQESFATYVGSKSFVNKSDRLSAKQSLNQEYQGYYRLMADMLSAVVRSDFLKVALAMASMQLIFSSRSLHSWATTGFDQNALLLDVPNDRLEVFRKWWSQRGSGETKALLDRSLMSQPWILDWAQEHGLDGSLVDFIDNDDRLFSDQGFCRELDAYIIPQLVAHLVTASPLEVISELEWQEALELVVQEAQVREIPLELEPGHDDLRAGDYRMSATADARTYIRTSPHYLVRNSGQMNQSEFRQHLGSPDVILGAIFCPVNGGSDRCDVELLGVADSVDGSGLETNFKSLCWIAIREGLAGLLDHSAAVDGKTEARNRGCILVPVSRPNIISQMEACALNKEFCIYLDADVFEFAIDHSADFEFGFTPFEAKDDLNLTAFWGRPKHTDSPHVLKCMPREAGRLFFAHLVRRGDVSIVDYPPPNIVREAIRLATTYWSWL